MEWMIAFLMATAMGMASGATAAADFGSLITSDATAAPFDAVAIASPAAEKSATRKLLEQVNGDVQTQPAKRERYSLRINTRNDAGERLSIRILRRARGACSGGRCG